MRILNHFILVSFLIALSSGCSHSAAVSPHQENVKENILVSRFNKLDNNVDTIKSSGSIWTEVLFKYRTEKYSFVFFYKTEDSIYLKAEKDSSSDVYELASRNGKTSLFIVKQMGIVTGKTESFEKSSNIDTPLKPSSILSGILPATIDQADAKSQVLADCGAFL